MPSVAPLALSSRTFAQAADEAIAEEEAAEAEALQEEPQSAIPVSPEQSSQDDEAKNDEGKRSLHLDTDEANQHAIQHEQLVPEDNIHGSPHKSPVSISVSGSFRSPFAKLSRRLHGTLPEMQPIINNDANRSESPAPPPASSATALPSARYARGYRSLGSSSTPSGGTTAIPMKVWLSFKTKLYLHILTFFLFYCAYLIMLLTPVEHFESGAILLSEDYAWFDAGYLAVVVHCAGGGFADVWPITRIGRFVTGLHLLIVFLLLVVP